MIFPVFFSAAESSIPDSTEREDTSRFIIKRGFVSWVFQKVVDDQQPPRRKTKSLSDRNE